MKSVLDSRQLLAARVLANTGSFTLAGQQLSLTQSAVSHAIKALEEEVECRLFTRSGKGVTLTPAGKHFLEYTDRILAQMETVRTLVAPRTARGKERLRLGVSAWSREYVMPVVLPVFQREFPHKLVAIEAGDHAHNLDLLDSGLLDLTFTARPLNRPDFEFRLLFADELRFIVAPGHPWARAGRARLEDLAGDTLLLHPGDYNLPAMLAEHFQQEQIELRHAVELNDPAVLKAVLKTGLAVGVLSTGHVKEELAQGTLVALSFGPRALVQQWGVVYHRQRQLSSMEKRLIELYHQAVPGVLSRMKGSGPALPPPQEAVAAPAPVEPYLRCSVVALWLASAYNFLSASMAGVNLESMAMAAS